MQQILALYCLLWPLGTVSLYKWATLPLAFIVFFVFFGVEEIGKQICQPFGTDYNDLPLETFCKQIEDDIVAVLQRTPAPFIPKK